MCSIINIMIFIKDFACVCQINGYLYSVNAIRNIFYRRKRLYDISLSLLIFVHIKISQKMGAHYLKL